MKIGQEIRSQIESAGKNPTSSPNGKLPFDHLVETQSKKLKEQELQGLMKDIALQGDKLAKFRSFRDLVKFKRMVKEFLQESVYQGFDLKKSHSFRFDGHSRRLAIVKEVDEKLIELTEEMVNKEKKTMNVLDTIGEIKGLLINLYT